MNIIPLEDPATIDPLARQGLFDRLSSGSGFGAAFGEAWNAPGGLAGGLRDIELGLAQDRAQGLGGPHPPVPPAPAATPMLTPDDANAQYGVAGQLKFDQPVRQAEATLLHGWSIERAQRQDQLARADQGLLPGAERVGASLLATALDPVNIGASFVPVVGEGKFALALGRLGPRFGRVAAGALAGAAGQAALEPLALLQAQSQHLDYDGWDSVRNIAFGGVLGGGLHLMFGRDLPAREESAGAAPEAAGGRLDRLAASPASWDPRDTTRGRLTTTSALVDAIPPERRAVYLRSAIDDMAEGRPVDVSPMLEAERAALGQAYDRVRADPQGPANDPLVTVRPEDMDAVAVSRGGWKGIGDVEVKGSGYGLVKFIWRHGEASPKAAADQVARDDIVAFPEVVRNPDALLYRSADGSRREWLVRRPDGRAVLYADRHFGAEGRHLVTVHVLEEDRVAAKIAERAEAGSGSPGRDFQVPPRDTPALPYDQSAPGRRAESIGLGRQGINPESQHLVARRGSAALNLPDLLAQAARETVARKQAPILDPEGAAVSGRADAAAAEKPSLSAADDIAAVEKDLAELAPQLRDAEKLGQLDAGDLAGLAEADDAVKAANTRAKAGELLGNCIIGSVA